MSLTVQTCCEIMRSALDLAASLDADQRHSEAGHSLESALIQAQEYNEGEETPELLHLFVLAVQERDRQYDRQAKLNHYLNW